MVVSQLLTKATVTIQNNSYYNDNDDDEKEGEAVQCVPRKKLNKKKIRKECKPTDTLLSRKDNSHFRSLNEA